MDSMPHIIVVDDEDRLAEWLDIEMNSGEYTVTYVHKGRSALEAVRELSPVLIMLERQLTDADSYDLCRAMRAITSAPILFTGYQWIEADKTAVLEAGGDDFVAKPLNAGLLLARIKAHLQRHLLRQQTEERELGGRLDFQELSIDLLHHSLTIYGTTIPLSGKEFELLLMMAKETGKVFSIEELYSKVWGTDSLGDTRTVLVHISNLRKKIERNPAQPDFIITRRGEGYLFNATPVRKF
ncbi:response regulator transcription factor [Paenibacillus senegalensis]|uniref:response regulator transcription factor n=1 Tax=Paenibacillus senegalensis TaxID=1465766 RepID=UPI000288FB50|nr:response regulator transcription factor [Paenibacillus senegalensis]